MLRERLRDLVRRLRGALGETSADPESRSVDRSAPPSRRDGVGGFDRPAPSTVDDADLVPRPQQLLRLLETNDGRLRQQEIIRETGWSSSTVSRHLRRLEDEGHLSRVLVGGEYLVLLPTVDPDGSVGLDGRVDGALGRDDPGYGRVDGGGLDADGEQSSD